MFKKTLIAAALLSSTSALAGEITIVGDAYKVGKEYLAAYTGSAGLSGDLQAGSIGIQYRPGIALGLNNTLKFTFTGGSLKADTSLQLQSVEYIDSSEAAGTISAVTTAVTAVTDATGTTQAELDVELAAAKTDAKAAIATALTSSSTMDWTADAANAAIDAVTVTDGDAAGSAKAAVITAVGGQDIFQSSIPSALAIAAELIDFEADANGDYTSALFKITADDLTASAILLFNDTESTIDGFSNATLQFTTATIGAGDLKIAVPEAKDDTGAPLNAPIASAKTLVTTATQYSVVVTKAVDTIDVEQDRKFFSDAIDDAQTGTATVAITENPVGLGIDSTAADFSLTLSGNTQGVDEVYYNNSALTGVEATDTGINLVAGTSTNNELYILVDGTSSLETREVGVTYKVTPNEADTSDFYLVGNATDSVEAFEWKLNGSEINFPYAPIGYDFIATNFEIANSGGDDAEVLITAFDTAGIPYSADLPRNAEGGKLTAISGDDIVSLFNLTKGTKLSITFTTSAPADDIKVSGYSIVDDQGGRMALLSDAYEGQVDNNASAIEAIKAVVDAIDATVNPVPVTP